MRTLVAIVLVFALLGGCAPAVRDFGALVPDTIGGTAVTTEPIAAACLPAGATARAEKSVWLDALIVAVEFSDATPADIEASIVACGNDDPGPRSTAGNVVTYGPDAAGRSTYFDGNRTVVEVDPGGYPEMVQVESDIAAALDQGSASRGLPLEAVLLTILVTAAMIALASAVIRTLPSAASTHRPARPVVPEDDDVRLGITTGGSADAPATPADQPDPAG